ncbi:hypothetical protein ACFOWX_08635 [Sphingorhabdus arenilitoris]|uniref:Lipopolysaccharide biosynthesis protein n=1 Tax=Sphingorhabdus arenilitoris TaxID=1490041 RepID=A0ABV8RGW1_9SPHN
MKIVKFITNNNLFKSLFSGRLSLGASTVFFQIAMLFFILILKLKMTDSVFALFLVSLGVASIFGAIASLRSEVLITQADRSCNVRALVWPILIAVGTIGIMCAIRPAINWIFSIDVPLYTAALAFGFSLQAICQFVMIQEAQFGRLLIIRAVQAAMLAITGLALVFEASFMWGVFGFTLSLVVPFAVWIALWMIENRHITPPAFVFSWRQIRRSLILSLTLLINTTAVNIPIILCVATQSASYAADFGFLIKVFTAPVTLANAMFGQLFLADNIRLNSAIPAEAKKIQMAMRRTSTIAVLFVLSIAAITIIGVLMLAHFVPAMLTYPMLSISIALAITAQAAFSPVSAIGDIAKLETPFLLFYIMRIALLYGMLSNVSLIDFSALFASINILAYSFFWLYADHRMRIFARGA